jgi:hypothetical protein
MLGAIQMNAADSLRPPSFLSFGTSSGASDDAARIASQFREFFGRFIQSATGSERVLEPRQAIYDLVTRCGHDNWNGDGAERITEETASRATDLLVALPSYLPVPDIFPDPSGGISFEWYRRPKHRLVLSIYANGTVEFAGLLGVGNEVYGEARMASGVPEIIRSNLRQLFTD